jgi:NTE family protein
MASKSDSTAKSAHRTAFVLAGGGSLGAVQVGMLKSLAIRGIHADMVVGSSVGAINGAYYAGRPSVEGVAALELLWRSMRRNDIFPLGLLTLARFIWRRDFLVSPDGISSLIDGNLPYRLLEEARIPIHIVTTDFLTGGTVVHATGPAAPAILASCAIPAAFEPIRHGSRHLVDGGIASNTPIRIAIELGATRLIVLPTGYSCALKHPPPGAVASALHGLTLLIAGQLIGELETIGAGVDFHVVPSLCPVTASAYDFSQTADLIDRAASQTNDWLDAGGLERHDIPETLRPHDHAR